VISGRLKLPHEPSNWLPGRIRSLIGLAPEFSITGVMGVAWGCDERHRDASKVIHILAEASKN
jgi:hypothetical protein